MAMSWIKLSSFEEAKCEVDVGTYRRCHETVHRPGSEGYSQFREHGSCC